MVVRRARVLGGLVLLVCAVLALSVSPAGATAPGDWTAYLGGAGHSSYNGAETAVTPANVAQLVQRWRWRGDAATMTGQPGPSIFSSPTVADDSVYLGLNNGYFYQLSLSTGTVQRKRFIGYRRALACARLHRHGDRRTGSERRSGHRLRRCAGRIPVRDGRDRPQREWRSVIDLPSTTVNDYFQWSSPTVANGKIYVGSASHCDKPLTRGAVVGFTQATGSEFARFFTVPQGYLGGGVWSSVAVASDGTVYATTGTQPKNTSNRFDSVSIVKLDGNTLQKLGSYTVPDAELGGDGDFGGSPTVFGSMVGACNKNGIYYALDRATMSVVWKRQIGVKSSSADPAQCSSAAIYDGAALYMAGDPTTINGVSYRGSIRKLNPATGAIVWQTGLTGSIIGSPTMNGGGVIGIGTYDVSGAPNRNILVDAGSGQVLRTLVTGGKTFGQGVFANGYVFVANIGKGLYAFRLP